MSLFPEREAGNRKEIFGMEKFSDGKNGKAGISFT
jgi:hypothetical protein